MAGESGVTDGAMEDSRVDSLMKSFMVEFKVSLNASFLLPVSVCPISYGVALVFLSSSFIKEQSFTSSFNQHS